MAEVGKGAGGSGATAASSVVPSTSSVESPPSDDPNSRLVEGVSNSVLGMFFFFLVTTMPFFYSMWRNRSQAIAVIHPSQQVIVDQFRRLVERTVGAAAATEVDDPPTENGTTGVHGVANGTTPFSSTTTAAPAFNQRTYNQDRTCPICFGAARYAITTNCGHMFCSVCITGYWQHASSPIRPIRCPVCRSEVSLLLPSFSELDPADVEWQEANQRINDYNRRFSGEPRPLWDHIRDLPVLLPYLIRRLFSLDGLMWVFRIRIILCLVGLAVYILSPLDIIPEAIFGLFGLLDDIFVAFVLLLYATAAFRQVMANRE